MPKALHAALRRSAKKKQFTGKQFSKYVYGGLKNIEKRKSGRKKRHKLARPRR